MVMCQTGLELHAGNNVKIRTLLAVQSGFDLICLVSQSPQQTHLAAQLWTCCL